MLIYYTIPQMGKLWATNLDAIAESPRTRIDVDTKIKVSKISQAPKERTFLLITSFVMDVFDRLRTWSLAMQIGDGLLVDFVSFFNSIVRSPEELKTGNDRYMTSSFSHNVHTGSENRKMSSPMSVR